MLERYHTDSLGEVYDRTKEFFGGRPYSLKDLFREERQRLIDRVLRERLEAYHKQFKDLGGRGRGVIRKLAEWHVALPPALGAVLQLSLNRAWEEALEEEAFHPGRWGDLANLVKHMEKLGLPLDRERLGEGLRSRMERLLQRLPGHSQPETLLARVRDLLLGVRSLNLPSTAGPSRTPCSTPVCWPGPWRRRSGRGMRSWPGPGAAGGGAAFGEIKEHRTSNL